MLAQPLCRQPGQRDGAGCLRLLAASAGSSAHPHPALQQCHPAHPQIGALLTIIETLRPRKPGMGLSFQLGDTSAPPRAWWCCDSNGSTRPSGWRFETRLFSCLCNHNAEKCHRNKLKPIPAGFSVSSLSPGDWREATNSTRICHGASSTVGGWPGASRS